MTSFQFMIVLVCCNIHDSSFFFAFQLVSNCNLSKKSLISLAQKNPEMHSFFSKSLHQRSWISPSCIFSPKKCLTLKMKPKYLHLSCSVAFLTWRAPLTPKLLMVFLSSSGLLHSESIEQTCKTIKAEHSNSPSLR